MQMQIQGLLGSFSDFPYGSVALAAFLSTHGLRRGSLSPSGALGAFVVASIMMAVPLRIFGISCIAFYLLGSRATKVGKELKGKLEADHTAAGYRNVWQVLANVFSAFIASVLWSALFVQDSVWSKALPENIVSLGRLINIDEQCPVSSNTYSRFLVFVTLGHFACCLGDTLASELGILSPRPPILITTLKYVPPGTNGAMSLVGTAVSFLGGFAIGLTIAITLLVQSSACRQEWATLLSDLCVWGFIAGGLGSLLDSLMGATIQRTRYSKAKKQILQDDSVVLPDDEVANISGINVLTNGQVNLVSSAITALLIGKFAARL